VVPGLILTGFFIAYMVVVACAIQTSSATRGPA